MPKTRTPRKPKPLYRTKPPKPPGEHLAHATLIAPAHFELREDGTIVVERRAEKRAPVLTYADPARSIWLYHGNCLELLDAIAAKYPEGRFDCIFADPPYFLSNGGITCHAGRMVKVDKGDWDKSQGADENHNFNLEWLRRCQRVLKPNGTIWVSGTHHVIFSIGVAMQQLGFKILNDIAWEKPNPPPNLSCRYFTHSTETILWAAKNEKSKHVFNYQEMRKVTGKQMKTVWRKEEFGVPPSGGPASQNSVASSPDRLKPQLQTPADLDPIWTMTAPGSDEKTHGKHPTQKPVALVERCVAASTNEGDLVLDAFLGGGTTAVACIRLHRGCVGTEMDELHFALAVRRADRESVLMWLREFRVQFAVGILLQNDLDPDGRSMDRINRIERIRAKDRLHLSRDEICFPLVRGSLVRGCRPRYGRKHVARSLGKDAERKETRDHPHRPLRDGNFSCGCEERSLI